MTEETARQRYVRLLKILALADEGLFYNTANGDTPEDIRAIHDLHGMGLVTGKLDYGAKGEPGRAFNVSITIPGRLKLGEWMEGPINPNHGKRMAYWAIAASLLGVVAAVWLYYVSH